VAEELEEDGAEHVDVLVLTRVTVQLSGPAETSVRDYAVGFVREALEQAVLGENVVGIPDPLGAVSAGLAEEAPMTEREAGFASRAADQIGPILGDFARGCGVSLERMLECAAATVNQRLVTGVVDPGSGRECADRG